MYWLLKRALCYVKVLQCTNKRSYCQDGFHCSNIRYMMLYKNITWWEEESWQSMLVIYNLMGVDQVLKWYITFIYLIQFLYCHTWISLCYYCCVFNFLCVQIWFRRPRKPKTSCWKEMEMTDRMQAVMSPSTMAELIPTCGSHKNWVMHQKLDCKLVLILFR